MLDVSQLIAMQDPGGKGVAGTRAFASVDEKEYKSALVQEDGILLPPILHGRPFSGVRPPSGGADVKFEL